MNDRKFLGAFLAATALTIVGGALYLNFAGASDENLLLLLRLTARASFLLLLVVFVARPLRQIIHSPFTQALLKNRPLIGVTFAGIHTAHFAVLVYRAQINPDFEMTVTANWSGAIVYALIFAMLVTTFSGPRRAIGPKAWRILHKVGLYVVTAAFVQTQLPRTTDGWSDVNWWMMSLIIAALVVRLTAFLARR